MYLMKNGNLYVTKKLMKEEDNRFVNNQDSTTYLKLRLIYHVQIPQSFLHQTFVLIIKIKTMKMTQF